MATRGELFKRRMRRTRVKLRRVSSHRPRLSVFRSNKNIYAQVIDDVRGETIASASTLDKELRDSLSKGGDLEAARKVGGLIAQRARAAGAENVIFDRGGYLYHGRVMALAEAAREGGLSF